MDTTANGGSQLARLNDYVSCTRQYVCAISAISRPVLVLKLHKKMRKWTKQNSRSMSTKCTNITF